jgi:transcriptional regulator with XRE-family HTH domain
MENNKIQLLFFQHIKSVLPAHMSFVDEVAEVLNISNDSAYRRIRGEKSISIDEMQQLAIHFNISIDQLLHLKSGSFIFSGELAGPGEYVFEKWLENIYNQLSLINSFNQKHLYYLAKDLPLMAQFIEPDLLAFKSFLWRRSILQYDNMRGMKFSFSDTKPEHLEMGKKIDGIYRQIPTTEIWNLESINSTIRQIEFYKEAKMFDSDDDVIKLYGAIVRIINHLEMQAESGLKFAIGSSPAGSGAAYNLLWNDLVLGDNTVMFEMDDRRITILNHSVINFIYTTDVRFNNYIFGMMQNLARRSTQLSRVGEKDRYRFFNRLRDKVKQVARF